MLTISSKARERKGEAPKAMRLLITLCERLYYAIFRVIVFSFPSFFRVYTRGSTTWSSLKAHFSDLTGDTGNWNWSTGSPGFYITVNTCMHNEYAYMHKRLFLSVERRKPKGEKWRVDCRNELPLIFIITFLLYSLFCSILFYSILFYSKGKSYHKPNTRRKERSPPSGLGNVHVVLYNNVFVVVTVKNKQTYTYPLLFCITNICESFLSLLIIFA